jgi:hypothetical protein
MFLGACRVRHGFEFPSTEMEEGYRGMTDGPRVALAM